MTTTTKTKTKPRRIRCYTCKQLFEPGTERVMLDRHRCCSEQCALKAMTEDGKSHVLTRTSPGEYLLMVI